MVKVIATKKTGGGAAGAGSDDQTAAEVPFTPAGGIAATDVQSAIQELDTEKQPVDPTLTAFAALAIIADRLPYGSGNDAFSLATLTAAGRALLDDADASAQLTTLGVSAFIKTLLDDADAAAARATLGIGGETLIEEIIVGAGGVATVDFQNIPATYRHLRLEALLRVENNGDWYEMRFNNDSAANYGRAAFGGGTGGLAQASNVGDSIWIGYITDDDTHADDAASMSIEIPYYAVTTMRKSCHSVGSTKIGSNNYAFVGGGNWRNTAAINRIQLFRAGADTAQHSRFALYGRA